MRVTELGVAAFSRQDVGDDSVRASPKAKWTTMPRRGRHEADLAMVVKVDYRFQWASPSAGRQIGAMRMGRPKSLLPPEKERLSPPHEASSGAIIDDREVGGGQTWRDAGRSRPPDSRRHWALRAQSLPRPIVVVRRLPLTVAMITMVTALAVGTGALRGATPVATIERWGFDLQNLSRGRLHTALTMPLLVFDRSHLVTILAMLAVFLAPLEAVTSTWIALKVFWLSTIGGAVLASILVGWPGRLLGWRPHPDLVRHADVGASVGAWGAAGALAVLVATRADRRPWGLAVLLGGYLLIALALYHAIADVEHLFGFAIGVLIAPKVDPQGSESARDSRGPVTAHPRSRPRL